MSCIDEIIAVELPPHSPSMCSKGSLGSGLSQDIGLRLPHTPHSLRHGIRFSSSFTCNMQGIETRGLGFEHTTTCFLQRSKVH
jgi:hypothetical protein